MHIVIILYNKQLSNKVQSIKKVKQFMIIQREANRRKREEIYRKELFDEIQSKQEKNQLRNRSRVYDDPPKEEFSLITNIEMEQEKRKNKQRSYYEQLERQRQEAIENKKKRQLEEKMERQRMDEKIRKENQALKKKYEEEIKREKRKQQKAIEGYKQDSPPPPVKRKGRAFQEAQQNPKHQAQNYPKDIIDNLDHNTHQIQLQQQQAMYNSRHNNTDRINHYNIDSYPYLSRIQNQQFNFPPRRVQNHSYFKQLLRERRLLDEQTNSLRDLNRMIHSEYLHTDNSNYNNKYGKKDGIDQLREMSKMIDQQSKSYINSKLSSGANVGTLRSKTQNSRADLFYQF